jgi:hypothetical protein
MSGIWRTVTVNPRGPFVRMHAPDLGVGEKARHCMACKRSRRIGWLSLPALGYLPVVAITAAATPVDPRRSHAALGRHAQGMSVRDMLIALQRLLGTPSCSIDRSDCCVWFGT